MSSGLRAVDEQLALERAGGNADLARELYQMLQNELPDYQHRLPALFTAGEMGALQEAVHKLNGSATYCGVPALKAAAESMESHLKRGEQANYETDLTELLVEIQRVLESPTLPL
ncbi:MAG TPA: Hpt domain-containing protein [Gammaproteobacteria bacterium]|jgi:two-component system sensor histidine kinase BarA